jgi:hypothetical protein
MGEVDVTNHVTRLVEHLTTGQADDLEVGLESRKILGLQDGQEPVGAMIGVQNLGHGRSFVHSTTTRRSADRPSVAEKPGLSPRKEVTAS